MSASTPHDGSPAKKQFKKEEERVSQCLSHLPGVSSTRVSQNNLAMESALSIFLVLKNIFCFLNDEDLKSCFNVCENWRSVADPMLFRYYKIIFQSDSDFILQELDPYNRKNLLKYDLNFKDAIATLEKVLLNQKIVIGLRVENGVDIQHNKNFLPKFGPFVKDLTFEGSIPMTLNVFCKFLLKSLPNLSSLHDFVPNKFDEDSPEDPDFNPDLPHNQHKQLKRIFIQDFYFQTYSSQQFQQILKMATNLQEIHGLHICLINEVMDKGPLVKSVHDCSWRKFDQNELTSLLPFEKLAELRPRLTSFSLLPSKYYLKGGASMELFKPFIFSILESSSESLWSLEMVPTESYGFQNLPPLKGLRTLVLTQPKPGRSGVGERYFSPEILLTQVFPNVNGIRILRDLTNYWINKFLPKKILSPWGSQIKRFYTQRLHPSSVPSLKRIFPEIEQLTLVGSASEIKEVLPTLAKFWPQLKRLTIFVFQSDYDESRTNGHPFCSKFRPGILDCALTGLPKEVVDQLLDQSKRENFTDDQIQGFKNQSNICKFKDLKQLILRLTDGYGWDSSTEEFTSLTHVTDEFGFQLLPDLKVTVGVEINEIVIKTELEPLKGSSNTKIKDLFLAHNAEKKVLIFS